MRSTYRAHRGNINMRGKKEKLLSCKCCSCLDLRDKIRDKYIREEVNLELNPKTAAEMSDDAHLYEGCNYRDWDWYYDL